MTDDDVWTSVVSWVRAVTNKTVIRQYESGARPANPYITVNFLGSVPVRVNEQFVAYDPPDNTGEEPDTAGEYAPVMAAPQIEREWRFSIFAYGDGSSDVLRPVQSAARLSQVVEPMFPSLIPHETSLIREIPEFVNQAWEKRSQMDFFVRGITSDGFPIDVIDVTSLDIERD